MPVHRQCLIELSNYLEKLKLDRQILLRVLAEVVDQLHAFRGELVDVGIEGVVGEEFSDCAFTALSGRDHIVDSFRGGVETGNRRARVVVDVSRL